MRSVFISYRRGDSEGQARSLNFELVQLLGKDAVFMDVDSIALGQDYRHVLRERLESCDLLLALIGPGWLDAKDAAGHRRLESPTDLVRQEIATALLRNIPVTPVLLQGAQMPPPERLPDDLKELVYRNGFELGHSTWEADVSELARRLGLDQGPATPMPRPVQSGSKAAPVSGGFKSLGTLAMFALIAIGASVLFYQWAHNRSSGTESATSIQQPVESLPQQPAGASSSLSGGFGVIRIANLKARPAEVYEQSSTAQGTYSPGYAGTISPATTTLQVPAGTYKLKFDNLFVEQIAVTSAGSTDIQLGTLSLPNLTRTAQVYDQNSIAQGSYSPGYAGTLSRETTTLQVPAGTYKLKFEMHFVENVAVTSARSSEIQLGTISLPSLTRTAQVYAQNSIAQGTYSPGYAGTLSRETTTLQVPAGTYKLKFDTLFVQPVRVEPGKTVIAQ